MNRTRMIETLKTHGLWDKLSSRTRMVMEEFRPQTPDNEEVGDSIAIVQGKIIILSHAITNRLSTELAHVDR